MKKFNFSLILFLLLIPCFSVLGCVFLYDSTLPTIAASTVPVHFTASGYDYSGSMKITFTDAYGNKNGEILDFSSSGNVELDLDVAEDSIIRFYGSLPHMKIQQFDIDYNWIDFASGFVNEYQFYVSGECSFEIVANFGENKNVSVDVLQQKYNPSTDSYTYIDESEVDFKMKQYGSYITDTSSIYTSSSLTLIATDQNGYTFKEYCMRYANGHIEETLSADSQLDYDILRAQTIFVRWIKASVQIDFDKQSGTGGTSAIEANDGESMPSITPPVRNGFTFHGYYTGKNGTGTKYYGSTGLSAHVCDFESDTTLYAFWVENTWIDYAASSFAGGNGTQANPYLINSAEQLAYLAKISQTNTLSGKYYKLISSIDLSAHVWEPIGNKNYRFGGTFDGGLCLIQNVRNNANELLKDCRALFGVVQNGTIRNVYLTNVTLYATNTVAGLIAAFDTGGTVENCFVENVTLTSTAATAGGLVGANYSGNVKSCYVKNVKIETSGDAHFGGLVGFTQNGSITDCSAINNTIHITVGYSRYGALLGYNAGGTVITASYAQSNINGTNYKNFYGNSSAWGNWSFLELVNDGFPVQKSLFAIGGFTDSITVYTKLKSLGFAES